MTRILFAARHGQSRQRSLVLVVLALGLSLPVRVQAQEDEPRTVEEILRGDGPSTDGEGWTADALSARVRETSPSLVAADAAIERAGAASREAVVALFPTLQLSARYTRINEVNNDPWVQLSHDSAGTETLVAGVDDPEARALWSNTLSQTASLSQSSIEVPQNQWSFDATLQVPVSELFLSLLPALEAADAQVDAERARREVTEAELDLRARQMFYGLVRARALVAVAEERLRDAEERKRSTEAAAAAGAARRSDVLRTEALYLQSEAARARAEAAELGAAEMIRAFAHIDGPIRIAEDVTIRLAPVTVRPRVLVDEAMDRRAEVQALRAATRAHSHAVDAQEGSRWPALRLGLGARIANPNDRFVPIREQFDTTWDVSAILSWSPNATVSAEARASASRADMAQTQAELANFQDALRAELIQAWADDRAANATVDEAEGAQEAAREAYRARRVEQREGQGTLSAVLDAEAELTQAQVGWIEANVGARIARARLSRLSGGAVEQPR
ncbi:MAG: TolC family protein [Myxococcota bacterium]